ncbi:unnamed protein product [Diabrotica balteata]|uniref:HAT C-terminal dimerisation domain-containing protein n=1 Tax=Diabrotica balteata TaxID=107213 RepID=A0A9N9TDA1_DIABA|nr:unnamed protein product [Diabrotica balteata]
MYHSLGGAILTTCHQLLRPTVTCTQATEEQTDSQFVKHIKYPSPAPIFKSKLTPPPDIDQAFYHVSKYPYSPVDPPFEYKEFSRYDHISPDVLCFQPYAKNPSALNHSLTLGLLIESSDIDGVTIPIPNIRISLTENNSMFLQGSIPILHVLKYIPSTQDANIFRLCTITVHSDESQPCGFALRDCSTVMVPRFDYQPFSIVEDRGFKKFVTALNPSYVLPNRKTISSCMIPAEYERCLNAVRHEVLSITNATLTTDNWTSTNVDNYLALTSHHISDDFELRSILLECSVMNSSHTSQNLALEINKIINKFHLNDKILIIVSDNANNIIGAITNELKMKHFGCFAHTLNLILQDALKLIQNLTDRIKSIITFFKRSTTSTAKLRDVQTNMGLNPKKLIQEVPTRWNSTYFMNQRIFELKDAVKTTIALINKNIPVLSEDEWKICSELVMILEPFEEVTRNMSGENFLTASQVIGFTNGLTSVCNSMKNEDLSTISNSVINQLLKGLKTRLINIENNKTIALATLLDPRFKLAVFTDEMAAESIKSYCTELMADIWRKKYQIAASTLVTETEEQRESQQEEKHPKFSIWTNLDKMITSKKKPSGSKTSAAIVELNRYLDEECINRKENPLLWWKQNQFCYPLLAQIVKKHFCVVATSVPCERLFSKAGNMITQRRTRLSTKRAEQLLFLNSNRYLIE